MSHTPGPWVYDEETNSVIGNGAVGPRDRLVADINGSVTFGVDSANGRLIAAAPDLLAALVDLVRRCDGEEGVRPDGSNIQTFRAHAAITKATGEP